MFTSQKPTHCPQCRSENIQFGGVIYKQDEDGEYTETIESASIFCNDCGTMIGSYRKGHYDVDPNSL